MSRARRLPRHRRPPRVVTAAAPLALGGAVAAVTLTATPLADSLRGGGRPGEHVATDDAPDVRLVTPAATGGPDRAGDEAPGRAARSAEREPLLAAGGTATGQGWSSGTGSAARVPSGEETGATPSSAETPTQSPLPSPEAGTATASAAPPAPQPSPTDDEDEDQPAPAPRLPGLPVPVPSIPLLP